MVKLSTGDVTEVSKIPPSTLNDWCRRGVVKPAEGGEGRGIHRRFTPIQLVAVAYAYQFVAIGYSTKIAAEIIGFLTAFSDDELLAEFAAGRTHLIPDLSDMRLRSWPDEDSGDIFNIEKLYHQANATIAKLRRRHKPNSVGRNRGISSR